MPLVAGDDTADIAENAAPATTSGNVTTNDSGGAGPLTVTAVNGSAGNVGQTRTGVYGTIRINADGSFLYTLNNADADTQILRFGQTGIDSFTYTVFDGTSSSTATIRVNVAGFNDLPNAVNDNRSVSVTQSDILLTGNVLTNDSDPESAVTLTSVNGSAGNIGTTITGTYGTFTLNADGSYSYTLDADDPDTQQLQYYDAVQEVFTYAISDGDGGTDTANVNITISGQVAPVAWELTGEEVVNTSVAGIQDFPAAAALASGGYVVTWLDLATTGNAEIRGQLYNASGAKVGVEFLVNSADAVSQLAPEIVSLDGGGFVVVWALEGGGVEAQIFSDTGAKLGAKIVVASGSGEMTPDVTVLDNGSFVISWQGQVSGHAEIKAQIYDSNGGTVGSQFLIDAVTATAPLVAGLEGGRFVVVQANGLAQLYDNNGAEIGGQFRAAPEESTPHFHFNTPNAIAPLPGGGFVLTWFWATSSAALFDPGNLSGQVFDANGAPVGPRFDLPEVSTQSVEKASEIAALPDGRIIITWESSGQTWAIILDEQGNKEGREFRVAEGTGLNPGLAVLASGDVAFTWANADDIKTQLFSVLDGVPHLGTSGDDTIRGDLGTTGEFMGLAGNDVYFVDESSDRVIERQGEGYDTVYAKVSYALLPGSEIEVLSAANWAGSQAINLTGNGFANILYGNAGDNVLDGGGGADAMTGFGGHDVYFVDNAGDTVAEATGAGFDTIYTSVNYTLGAGVHAEVLSVIDWTATTPLNLTGNALANRLYGNAGANVLSGGDGGDWLAGGGGGDTLIGGSGDDVYWIYAGSDVTIETAGNGYDTAYLYTSYALAADASVEVLSTYSWITAEAINLTGNGLTNQVFGNAGANVLNGGGGNDLLTGFGGADTFAFTTALGAGNVDTVADMVAGSDRIGLDDAIFTQAGPLGTLNANAFVTGTAAGDADDRIIYNSATGQLFYDADGNGVGAAVQFATLGTGLSLAASDFVVI